MRRPVFIASVFVLLLLGSSTWIYRNASKPVRRTPPSGPELTLRDRPPATPTPPVAGSTSDPTSPPPALGSRPSASAAPLAVTTAPVLPEDAGRGIVRHWQGRLATPLRARGPGPDGELYLPLRFEFPLNEQRAVPVVITRHDVTGADAGVFTGTVENQPDAVVILSYVGTSSSGIVQLPDEQRSFVITGRADGQVRITENNLAEAPGCTPPLVPPSGS